MKITFSSYKYLFAGLIAVSICIGCDSDSDGKKPNIVIFISDDHGYEDSGAYGDSYIETPNINRLAEESMLFTNAFAASPLCSPSRCVIETGLMPFRNGGHKFGTAIRDEVKTMPEYFSELGYYTAHIGKFHHPPQNKFPYDSILPDENHAVSFLHGYNIDQPLFLVICTHPPHTPWIKNRIYDPRKIQLPPNFIDTPETREDRARYYSDVTLMDSILGNVLNVLRNRDLENNTLFVYTSDQGANWPFAKWCVYDAGLRVPFITRWPGEIKAGSVSNAIISLADILPTCIEAAGGDPPEDIDGDSFMKVIIGKTDSHREVVFGTHTGNDNGGPGIANHCPARMIRTRQYQYILNLEPDSTFFTHITGCKPGDLHHLPFWNSWVKKAETDERAGRVVQKYLHRPLEELYDLENDPYQMNNLASYPEYSGTLRSLKEQLADWRRMQRDTILVNEGNYQDN